MRDTSQAIAATVAPASLRHALIVATFCVALFGSALLMFLIQPMVGKLLLPRLGGTPQVWNACMVFFQAMLFAGYLHAHFTGALLGLRRQAVVHLLVAGVVLFTLPLALTESFGQPDTARPVLWIMKVLLVSIGGPVFVIAATAPLLQKWFAHTSHPAAHDPYFLYVASNLGSLLALLGYPLLVEPLTGLAGQTMGWSGGYMALAVLLLCCALLVWQNFRAMPSAVNTVAHPGDGRITHRRRAHWLLLSFVPSSLLLGVTTYITTDIAAVPLFWIIPLALYLLSFILVFAAKPLIPHAVVVRGQGIALALLVAILFLPLLNRLVLPPMAFCAHLAAFFFTAMVCHGELARTRPAARDLTEFYLWLSLGGVLGGVFNALIAPVTFSSLIEYPLVLMFACLLRPWPAGDAGQRVRDLLLPLLLFAVLWCGLQAMRGLPESAATLRVVILFALLIVSGMVLVGFSERPLRFALGVSGALSLTLLGGITDPAADGTNTTGLVARSFFGVYRVYDNEAIGMRILRHGTTLHGAQSLDPQQAHLPASYYHRAGPFGDIFAALPPRLHTGPVAVVGLGTGALACYGHPGGDWTFYEIDPLIEKIARDPRHFTYLRDCPPRSRVVIGDARLTMDEAANGSYGLIIIDAFTSDAIPTHLLTREAIAGYMKKLAPGGVLALHISNRHMNLAPVLGNVARDASLVGRVSALKREGTVDPVRASPASVMVLARSDEALAGLATDARWLPLPQRPAERVWTDDYVNILSILWAN